ncbi:thioredoxin domain-containing protein [Candidatus Woesearchaeota archaeon]|nr:thioredoxin domain-containing protein [Candidatus Woesearchaeota archaeon]
MKDSEKRFAILACIGILALGFLVLNIEKIFPTPQQQDFEQNLPKRVTVDFDLSTGTNPEANVALIEFSDFQCPFCQQNYEDVKQMVQLYGNKINFVYKHFPLTEIHPNAFKAAEAMECARDQEMALEYHNKLFETNRLTVPDLKEHANVLGLDMEAFNHCLDAGVKAERVKKDMNDGIRLGVQGTPTFMVGERMLVGVQPAATLKALLDAELQYE